MKLANALLFAFLILSAAANAQEIAAPLKLSLQSKNEVLESVIKQMNDIYIFPETAAKVETAIRNSQKDNTYESITDTKEFAKSLTAQLREITHDKHIRVGYNPNFTDDKVNKAAEKEEERQYAQMMARKNFGFSKAEILSGNVGYFKLDAFISPDLAAKTADGVIAFLSKTEALIIDLRENHGGEPEMVQHLASYFFDRKPVHLNDIFYREGNKTETYWTKRKLPGVRYLNKSVYILTSNETFSGGEEFSYDLQVLKRATIIGETTGGGANPGGTVDLPNDFTIFIPNGRAINPHTKTNWEGIGVKPEISTSKSEALKTAHILALKTLLQNQKKQRRRSLLQEKS